MLVVMDSGTSDWAVAAVRDRAREAGLDTTLYAGTDPAIIQVTGDNADELAPDLSALPGVTQVMCATSSAAPVTSNLRIAGIRPLVPPAILVEQLPLPAEGAVMVHRTRQEVRRILRRAGRPPDRRRRTLLDPRPRAPRSTMPAGWRRWPTSWRATSGSSCASTSRSRARPSAGRG